jgi:hypothetical protein
MLAVRSLVASEGRDTLEALLDEYPAQPGMYYYNVVAGLDWYLYAAPGADRD